MLGRRAKVSVDESLSLTEEAGGRRYIFGPARPRDSRIRKARTKEIATSKMRILNTTWSGRRIPRKRNNISLRQYEYIKVQMIPPASRNEVSVGISQMRAINRTIPYLMICCAFWYDKQGGGLEEEGGGSHARA